MVAKAVPTLGNVRQASWASMQAALAALQYPVALEEATARFMAAGGPMLNMLRTKGAVLVVGLHVRIDGTAQQHCVMLSTLPEPHAPYGKLVDKLILTEGCGRVSASPEHVAVVMSKYSFNFSVNTVNPK